MGAYPSILDAQTLKRLAAPDVNVAQMPSANPLATSPAPVAPSVTQAPPPLAISNTNDRLLGDQTELKRLNDTGSGISQIKNPLLRALGRIGDVAETVLAPNAAALTPGTSLNHARLVNQQQGYVNNDLANQGEQAKTGQEQALTDYTLQRPEIEQSKIDQRQTAVQERVAQSAAARGQKTSWDAQGLPVFTDDMNSQEYKDHQALSAMHQATADKNKVLSDIQQNHYIPGTPEFDEAQRKLAQIDQRQKIAMAGLGLRAQGLELRKENTDATLYGTDTSGKALPGSAQIAGDNGQTQTIGSKFAPTAIKQQNNVGSFNDLSGSVSHLRNAIKAYEAEGGDMSDARLAAAAADPSSTVGKVVQGKLVTNGLSPAAITLLNAQRQTMEQAGILRKTTGGTASEAGAQRILEVVPKFGSDTNTSAYNKLDEQEGVLQRLAPGVTGVAGGMSVKNRPSTAHTTFKTTATGPGGHKIGTNDGTNWFDVATGKAIE